MVPRIFAIIFLLLTAGLASAQVPQPAHRQCLLILADSDTGITGTLYMVQWNDTYQLPMMTVNFPVVLGKNGCAWGPGLQPENWNTGTLKKEGDGKTPKGIFDLGLAFGYAPKDTGIHHPYIQVNQQCFCVDDPKATLYGRIVNTAEITPDWKSAEPMLRNDDLYEWGLEIEYNPYPARPGAGSCIFFHVWRSSDKPTAGCVAMPNEYMQHLLHLLKRELPGYVVIMTRADYWQHRSELGLPIP